MGKLHLDAPMLRIKSGGFWNPTCQAGQRPEVLLRAIPGIPSMRFLGASKQARSGEICPLTLGMGKMPVVAFVAGEMPVFGGNSLEYFS